MEKVRLAREMAGVFAQGGQLKGERARIALVQEQNSSTEEICTPAK